ncbi:MAG TPA: hypothetical protein VKK79_10900 [Candidatus Lokiarchaeia archaeon]|nr:hypothetical protein [Candidatus Lokiarchaeia archaeon]
MPELKIIVPHELKVKMDRFPAINWSEIAQEAFIHFLEDLQLFEDFSEDSSITEQDALDWGRKVNAALVKRYEEQ